MRGPRPLIAVRVAAAATAPGTARRLRLPGLLLPSLLLLGLLAIALLPGRAMAAEEGNAQEPVVASDPYGRESPRSLQTGLISAMGQHDFALLAYYLDVPDPESEAATRKAQAFQQLLDDHGTFLKRLTVAQTGEGKLDDGLPAAQEKIGELDLDGEIVPVLAARTERPEGPPIWRIAQETLDRVPDEPAATPSEDADDAAPEERPLTLFGAPIESWIVLLVAGGVIYGLVILIVHLIGRQLGHDDRGMDAPVRRMLRAFAHPAALYFVYVAVSYLAEPLGAGLAERIALERMSSFVGWLAVIWFLWRLIGVVDDLIVTHARAAGRYERIGFSNFLSRLIRLGLIAIAIAALLATFGVDVTAGLAALGVGGLALALGARKSVEDLVGSVMVLMDKPVRIGDKCRINGVIGVVEDIGLRSTRIRSNERTLLTIPNSKFADTSIESLTARDRFLVNQTFGVPFTVGSAGLEAVLRTVREAFEQDNECIPAPCPVRLRGFAEGSFQIQIFGYVDCRSTADFYLAQERLLLDMLRRLEALGIAIALPATRLELSSRAVEEALRDAGDR